MMSFIAHANTEWELHDYILGDVYKGMSLATQRYYYLQALNTQEPIKISLRDPSLNVWTKWASFPSLLLQIDKSQYGVRSTAITAAVDVHRSILSNEIVIESDYPTYEENYQAMRLFGAIVEQKGFQPSYYYSGNKSIHAHIFFDWAYLKEVDLLLQDRLKAHFKNSVPMFRKKFIEYLRTKMISCWDLNIVKFDKDLIKATHLIRAELSRNKQGFKTFIGYTYKDLSFVPYICNEENRIYPSIGIPHLSRPHEIDKIMGEFLNSLESQTALQKAKKSNRSLMDWGGKQEGLRGCVKCVLSEDFASHGDGFQRGMFILLNELKIVYGDTQARTIITDWNHKMGGPVRSQEIEYRLNLKTYKLPCHYIHAFLEELGITISKKCDGKI